MGYMRDYTTILLLLFLMNNGFSQVKDKGFILLIDGKIINQSQISDMYLLDVEAKDSIKVQYLIGRLKIDSIFYEKIIKNNYNSLKFKYIEISKENSRFYNYDIYFFKRDFIKNYDSIILKLYNQDKKENRKVYFFDKNVKFLDEQIIDHEYKIPIKRKR